MNVCKSCGRTVADRAPCVECAEPRASVMPPHMESVDPIFADAVREYGPDEKTLREKGVRQ